MNSLVPPVQHPPVWARESPHLQREAALAQVWQRLSPRLARSAERACRHVTARAADMPCEPGPDGVAVRVAYDIDAAAAEPGEPIRIRLIDLPAGVCVEMPIDAGADSAWLVMDGAAQIGGVPCAALDYQQRHAGDSRVMLSSAGGARLMLREARPYLLDPGGVSDVDATRATSASPTTRTTTLTTLTTRADQMAWEPLAEGISRRLLAPPRGAAAAYLVRMAPGAAAPAHRHGRAEECMLLAGEMYLDDLLLFGGDFQLAPAGGLHHEASSEHGVLLAVHGDLDLDVISTELR